MACLCSYLGLSGVPSVETPGEWPEMVAGPQVSKQDKKALASLSQKSPDELADELLVFAGQQCPESKDDAYFPSYVSHAFWKRQGLQHGYTDDADVILKMTRAEHLARQKWGAEREEAQRKLEQERVEKERETLPKTMEECLEWAKKNRVKRITYNDLDYFLGERRISLSPPSKRALYAEVNFKLKV